MPRMDKRNRLVKKDYTIICDLGNRAQLLNEEFGGQCEIKDTGHTTQDTRHIKQLSVVSYQSSGEGRPFSPLGENGWPVSQAQG
jgi:hypothetical protein